MNGEHTSLEVENRCEMCGWLNAEELCPIHQGCLTCKHLFVDDGDYPCSACDETYTLRERTEEPLNQWLCFNCDYPIKDLNGYKSCPQCGSTRTVKLRWYQTKREWTPNITNTREK